MRIALIGQAAFGEAVFKKLVDQGHDVVGVCAPATPEGGRPDPLRAAAEAASLPVISTRQLHHRRVDKVWDQYVAWNADLCVMAFVTDIIAEKVLFHPPLKTIQYHPSLLPLHRGASAIAWSIIMGDAKTGLTIFWPDEGIDTGPVLLQKEVAIAPDDTVTSLYFNKLFPIGVDAMVEAVDMVRAGTAPRVDQDHSQATYEAILKDDHTWLDWNEEPQRLYNLIRGANPTPGANVMFRDAQLKLFDSALVSATPGKPAGEIVAVDDSGVSVALNGATLLVKRVQVPGGAKTPVAAWAAENNVRAGERFGNRPAVTGS